MTARGVDTVYPVSGEVVDREEKLDADCFVALDGWAQPAPGQRLPCAITLSWSLGREGATALTDGDLVLMLGGDGGAELSATLERGSVMTDPDSGVVHVELGFTVDEGAAGRVEQGALVRGVLELAAMRWSGELRVREIAPGPPDGWP